MHDDLAWHGEHRLQACLVILFSLLVLCMHVSHALACTALRVMFEKNLYPVREDVGNLSYRLIAVSSKTASFSYEVIVTAVDGTAKCEPIHLYALEARGY